MDTSSLPTSMEDTEEYLRSLEPPPIFIDEWAETEHPDALTDSLLGCAFLEAADGSGSLTFHTPRYYSAKLRQALSAPEKRHLAVKHFMRAADAFQGNPDAFPGEAWVRFQIGWYSFAYEEGPRDLQLARTALERVLELDLDNAPAHLALAWLLYQEQQRQKVPDTSEATPAWDNVIGQHLRNAMYPRLGSHLREDINIGRLKEGFDLSRTSLPYIVLESGHSLMLQALEELDPIVPDNHRFAYAMAHYHVATGDELELLWLEEALRCPHSDDLALYEIHRRVARSMIFHRRDFTGGYKHFVKAHDHLVRLAEHDRGAAVNSLEEWFFYKNLPDDIDLLQHARPAFLEFVDACMDLFERGLLTEWIGLDDATAYNLGELTAIAGWLLLKAGEIQEARTYLTHALEFEQALSGDDGLNPDSEPLHRRALHWRVLLARSWRHICRLDGDYAGAHKQNELILNWLPNDSEALDLKLQLDQMRLSALQHGQLVHISAGTEFLVQEAAVALERSANDRLQKLLSENANDPQGMDSILDQLSNLVQQGSKIQPAALRSASYRAISELGTDVFNNLHPDSQHFLTTAEVFYAASESIASDIDASPVVVEYAKVVETELWNSFLPALARGLEADRFKGKLRAGREEIGPEFRSDGHAKWDRKLKNLSLGNIINLLEHAIDGTDNQPIWKILDRLQPGQGWFRDLTHDLDEVVKEYRNGAAHKGRMSREAAAKLRDLLFTRVLLRRLVELKKLCDKIP